MSTLVFLVLSGICLVALALFSLGALWAKRKPRAPLPGDSVEALESETVRALAGGLVHEIRNPLNALSVSLQLLEEDGSESTPTDPRERATVLREMQQEIKRIDGILKDFLRLARPPEVILREEDPCRIIDSVLLFLGAECERHNVRIVRSLDSGASVLLDAGQFKQAMFNLILNALQSMPEGGEIRVRVRVGMNLVVEIEDTGMGIPANIQPRIFDLFFSSRRGGTGLGLPIVQRIIHDHAGRMTFSSQEGRGTCFTITLPLAKEGRGSRQPQHQKTRELEIGS